MVYWLFASAFCRSAAACAWVAVKLGKIADAGMVPPPQVPLVKAIRMRLSSPIAVSSARVCTMSRSNTASACSDRV